MATLLRRELAPLDDRAWQELDAEAARVLRHHLVARRLVDVSGPHGWQLGAVNLGRLESTDRRTPDGVGWGARQTLPLIEVRLPLTLRQMELDDLARGRADADIEAVRQAAATAATFEDTAVFKGFSDGRIEGILAAAEHEPVTLPAEAAGYPGAVAEAVSALTAAGIGGPYALVIATDQYLALMSAARGGYPPHRVIKDMLQGEILPTGSVDGGVVLSTRGGDFELTLGADYAIGYAAHDRDTVELYLTESFTFRALEPKAAVTLKPPA
jgi:uncharacterized linocin/CFP29 family protein